MFPLQSVFQSFILGGFFITWHNMLQLIINASNIPQEGRKGDAGSCGKAAGLLSFSSHQTNYFSYFFKVDKATQKSYSKSKKIGKDHLLLAVNSTYIRRKF